MTLRSPTSRGDCRQTSPDRRCQSMSDPSECSLHELKYCGADKMSTYRFDVFLGGACNPTTWRRKIAIPFLEGNDLTFYNPQVSEWHRSLIEIEASAKSSSRILLFVFELWLTRCISSFVEVAYLAAKHSNLVLVMSDVSGSDIPVIHGEQISEVEFSCLESARQVVLTLASQQSIPVFPDLHQALLYVKQFVHEHRYRERQRNYTTLSFFQGVFPLEYLARVFHSLTQLSPGLVSLEQTRIGLQRLGSDLPCHLSSEKRGISHLVDFQHFVLYYVQYIRQHWFDKTIESEIAIKSCTPRRFSLPFWSCDWETEVEMRFGVSASSMSSLPNVNCSAKYSPANSSCDRVPRCHHAIDVYFAGFERNSHSGLTSNFLRAACSALSHAEPVIFGNLNGIQNGRISQFDLWARNHSRVLFFYVDSTSLNLSTMVDAAFAIGSGREVVICVETISIAEASSQQDVSVHSSPVSPTSSTTGQPGYESSIPQPLANLQNQTTDITPCDQKSFQSLSLSQLIHTCSRPKVLDDTSLARRNDWISRGLLIPVGDSNSPLSVDSGVSISSSPSSNLGSPLLAPSSCSMESSFLPSKRVCLPDSVISELSQMAIKDHNRGRSYLQGVANEMGSSVTDNLESAFSICLSVLLRQQRVH